jgi:hypothetical protein
VSDLAERILGLEKGQLQRVVKIMAKLGMWDERFVDVASKRNLSSADLAASVCALDIVRDPPKGLVRGKV